MTVSKFFRSQEKDQGLKKEDEDFSLTFFGNTGSKVFTQQTPQENSDSITLKLGENRQIEATYHSLGTSFEPEKIDWIRGVPKEGSLISFLKNSFISLKPLVDQSEKFSVHLYPRMMGGMPNKNKKRKNGNNQAQYSSQRTQIEQRPSPKKARENDDSMSDEDFSSNNLGQQSQDLGESNMVSRFQDPMSLRSFNSIAQAEAQDTSLDPVGKSREKQSYKSAAAFSFPSHLTKRSEQYSEKSLTKTAFSESIDQMVMYLAKTPNPFLAQKLLTFLKPFGEENGDIIDLEKGVPFEKGRFSIETEIAIEKMNLAILQERDKMKDDHSLMKIFRDDLGSRLRRAKVDESRVWNEARSLFQLSQVMSLPDPEQERLLKVLEEGENPKKADIEVRTILQKSSLDLDQIDIDLKKENEKANLTSTISQAIRKRPRKISFFQQLTRNDIQTLKNTMVKEKDTELGVVNEIRRYQDGIVEIELKTTIENKRIFLTFDSKGNATKRTIKTLRLSSVFSEEVHNLDYYMIHAPDYHEIHGKRAKLNEKSRKIEVFDSNDDGGLSNDDGGSQVVGTLQQDKSGSLTYYPKSYLEFRVKIPSDYVNKSLHLNLFSKEEQVASSIDGVNAILSLGSGFIDPREAEKRIRRELNEELQSLSRLLINKESLLEKLLESIAKNDQKKVDVELVDSEVKLQLRKIENTIREKLKEEKDREAILKEAVLEANYLNITNPEKKNYDSGREVAIIMEMLQKSEAYREEVKGKEGVLFVGPTGAGKSLTIGWLLENEVTEQKNALGESVYGFKNPSPKTPQVGHAIATSETLFTQGFKYKDESKSILMDTAGCSETRGGNYEICGRISLDRAIKALSALRSVVFVIPASYFTTSRGALLTDFFVNEMDQFPAIFDSKKEDRKSAFVLVTKALNLEESFLENLNNGKLIGTYQEELKKKEREILDSKPVNEVALAETRRKLRIFDTLQNIFTEERFDVVFPEDNLQQDELTKKFIKHSRSIPKEHFNSGMQSPVLMQKYVHNLISYADTWSQRIFGKQRELRSGIEQTKKEISKRQEEIESIKLNQKKFEEGNNKEIESLEQLIEKLIKSIENKDLDSLPNEEEVKKLLKNSSAANTEHYHEKHAGFFTRIAEVIVSISKLKSGALFHEYTKEMYRKLQDVLRAHKDDISQGDHEANIIAEPGEDGWEKEMTLGKIPREEVRKSISEIRHIDGSKFTEERIVKTKDYRGSFSMNSLVHKDEPVLPPGEEFLKLFREKTSQNIIGDHRIQVKKQNAEITHRNSSESGTSLVYRIEYDFKGNTGESSSHPFIKIDHLIPNTTFNRPVINNLQNSIAEINGKIENHAEEAQNKAAEIEEKNSNLTDEEVRLKTSFAEEKQERENQQNLTLIQLSEEYKRKIGSIRESTVKNKETAEKSLAEAKKHLADEKEKLKHLFTEKRNIALVILNKIESAKTLNEFAKMSLDNNHEQGYALDESKVNKRALEKACSTFVEEFDEKKIEDIIKECKEDLCPQN